MQPTRFREKEACVKQGTLPEQKKGYLSEATPDSIQEGGGGELLVLRQDVRAGKVIHERPGGRRHSLPEGKRRWMQRPPGSHRREKKATVAPIMGGKIRPHEFRFKGCDPALDRESAGMATLWREGKNPRAKNTTSRKFQIRTSRGGCFPVLPGSRKGVKEGSAHKEKGEIPEGPGVGLSAEKKGGHAVQREEERRGKKVPLFVEGKKK